MTPSTRIPIALLPLVVAAQDRPVTYSLFKPGVTQPAPARTGKDHQRHHEAHGQSSTESKNVVYRVEKAIGK